MKLIRLVLPVALLLVTAHRLPAPIQEVQESPTPAATPTPKQKSSKTERANEERKHTRSNKMTSASATAQPTVPRRNVKRFAGTWTGTMHAENGQTYPVTVVIDPTETKATANGPVFANEDGRVKINGDTLSWNWMLDSWTMTVNSETTAQLVKRYFSSVHTGTIKRIK